jgi:hypothetical protein
LLMNLSGRLARVSDSGIDRVRSSVAVSTSGAFTYRPVGCSYLPEVGVSSWTEVILGRCVVFGGIVKQEAMAQQGVSYDGGEERNIVMPRGRRG